MADGKKSGEKFTNDSNGLQGVIDRFEGDWAVILLDDGQSLNWPKSKLPLNLSEGSVVRLSINESKLDEEERKTLARTLLNEIFKKSQ